MDPTSVAAIISIFSNLCDLAKKGSNLLNLFKKNDKTLELRKLMLEIEENTLVLKENYLKAQDKIKELEIALRIKTEMVFEKGVFWGKDGTGPFCPKCAQTQHIQAHLKPNNPNEAESWICTACGQTHISPEGQKRLLDLHEQAKFKSLMTLSNSKRGF